MISSIYQKVVGSSPLQERSEPRILCVGLCCLDIIHTCKHFPIEDSEMRSVDYWWQRGGNSSNTCTVLSILGNSCELLSTLSSREHLNFMQNDFRKYKINFSKCPLIEGAGCPMSTVILNLGTGSRTIIHHNPNLPELSFNHFQQLDLSEYSWIHFEGRNVSETLSMMQHIESYNNSLLNEQNPSDSTNQPSVPMPITISVELEKSKSELLDLLPYVDVAFVSKEFARGRGYENMSETLKCTCEEAKSGATVICAWGDRGAMAHAPNGTVVQSPAFSPSRVVDSLGAGDTFNAAVLHYLNNIKMEFYNDLKEKAESALDTEESSSETSELKITKPDIKTNYNIESTEYSRTEFINQVILQDAITFGCRIAGAKIGFKGFDRLYEYAKRFAR